MENTTTATESADAIAPRDSDLVSDPNSMAGKPSPRLPSTRSPVGISTTPSGINDSIAAIVQSQPVLYGRTGPKPEDCFSLTNLRMEQNNVTAEYHEPNDKAIYEVSGPITASTWRFAGTKWIFKPAGAMGAPKNFSATLELHAAENQLRGTFKISGIFGTSGNISVSCDGREL